MSLNLNTKKLNTLTLSGLIIGPILGSGIILLPPLIYNMVGSFSLIIWGVILILGFVFALIFGKLAILYPGEGGVSLATKEAMGKKYQLLTSFYLICAVFFGPVAVLIIAAKFIQNLFPDVSVELLAFFIYIITYFFLRSKVNFIGKVMLIVSSTITVLFLLSSIVVLTNVENYTFSLPIISFNEFGYALLVVFWSIVGWEVIGNYSKEVEDTKTLTKSIVFSATIISIVYIFLTLAITLGEFPKNEEFKLVWLIEPLFGKYASFILAVISVILCIGTLILFVGAVSRLVASLKLTSYTSAHSSNNVPVGALNVLSSLYIITLFLVYLNYITLDELVAYSDAFFIANALIGLVTAIILFKKGFLRTASIVLSIIFFSILIFSNLVILSIIFTLFILVFLKK